MARIQVKRYVKKYLRGKGRYPTVSYYVYIPKRIAERHLGEEFEFVEVEDGILMRAVRG
ncbi:MAG: hypothetical protein ACE5Z5_01725 [Candidatus Bathyarchaeia archaeon]